MNEDIVCEFRKSKLKLEDTRNPALGRSHIFADLLWSVIESLHKCYVAYSPDDKNLLKQLETDAYYHLRVACLGLEAAIELLSPSKPTIEGEDLSSANLLSFFFLRELRSKYADRGAFIEFWAYDEDNEDSPNVAHYEYCDLDDDYRLEYRFDIMRVLELRGLAVDAEDECGESGWNLVDSLDHDSVKDLISQWRKSQGNICWDYWLGKDVKDWSTSDE